VVLRNYIQGFQKNQNTFEPIQHLVARGTMEKVWEELKKIEAEAEQIRSEAQEKAKDLTTLAQQNGEKLIANSQTYAEEEAQQLFTSTVEEANRRRDEQLKANQAAAEKLKVQAEKHMEEAISEVVNAIIEEAEP
jgi:vacuolar-type H+-ATPase subunit H